MWELEGVELKTWDFEGVWRMSMPNGPSIVNHNCCEQYTIIYKQINVMLEVFLLW